MSVERLATVTSGGARGACQLWDEGKVYLLRECGMHLLHLTRGSVLGYASRHEAVGVAVQIRFAWTRFKYRHYDVFLHRVCPPGSSQGGQTEYHLFVAHMLF